MLCHSCVDDFGKSELNQVDCVMFRGYSEGSKYTLLLCTECMNKRLSFTGNKAPTIKSCSTCHLAIDGRANNRLGSPCLWACRSFDKWEEKDA